MFDQECGPRGGEGRLTTAALRSLVDRLGDLDLDVPDAERIEQIGLLEALKGAACGAQARVTGAFDTSQREQQAARGVPARERGRGVASQVALARRDSPARGSCHLGLARALVHEMPHTLEHLSAGRVSEWRATVLCRETAVLRAADRSTVDARMGADLPTMGDAAVARTARALAYELNAESAREAPGWRSEVVSAGPGGTDTRAPAHTVRTTTPSGHTYLSTAPAVVASRIRGRPAGHQDAGSSATVLEGRLADLLAA